MPSINFSEIFYFWPVVLRDTVRSVSERIDNMNNLFLTVIVSEDKLKLRGKFVNLIFY